MKATQEHLTSNCGRGVPDPLSGGTVQKLAQNRHMLANKAGRSECECEQTLGIEMVVSSTYMYIPQLLLPKASLEHLAAVKLQAAAYHPAHSRTLVPSLLP